MAKGVEAPCAIRRRIAPEIPESTFLDILRNIFYKGKIRVPATKTEPEVIVDGLHEPLRVHLAGEVVEVNIHITSARQRASTLECLPIRSIPPLWTT